RWDTRLQTSEIGVVVADGVATLTGNVDSLLKKFAAEDAAQHVHGVRAVANEIEVRLPSLSERSDSDIAHAVATALVRGAKHDAHKIRVEVLGRTIILRGTVRSWAERNQAQMAAWSAPGVNTVQNLISVSI